MSRPGYDRSDEQVRQERASGVVSDVLLNLEQTLEAARRGRKLVEKDGAGVNAQLALADLIKDLERLRKRFTQDTYYAVDTRLI
jgi:hypothetical protein